MLTCVHFNAGVLGKGGGFPNAYLNKSDRTGTTQARVSHVRFFTSAHSWDPAKRTQGERNSEFFGELAWFTVFEILS